MSENRVSVLGELFITQYGHAAMGYGTGTINDAQYGKAHESLFRYVRNLERSINNARPIEDALNKRIAELEGVIKADNERLIRAGLTVGLYSGCDTAETMAEVILASRDRIAELETERDEARAMVERLIEAGDAMIVDPAVEWFDVHYKWRKIIAEWQEMQK